MRGFFITLEGIDGTGKSTQARLLAAKLQEQGMSTVLTREPGGTPVAEKIREILLTESGEKISPPGEALLYAAARAQHVSVVIRPALAEGKVVICERFTDSTLAYQGYGSGLDLDLIRKANAIATEGLVPDLTFLLDIETREGWNRIQRRNNGKNDRMEAKGVEFLERVRRGYLELAGKAGERFVVLDCNGKNAGEVHEILWRKYIDNKKRKGG